MGGELSAADEVLVNKDEECSFEPVGRRGRVDALTKPGDADDVPGPVLRSCTAMDVKAAAAALRSPD